MKSETEVEIIDGSIGAGAESIEEVKKINEEVEDTTTFIGYEVVDNVLSSIDPNLPTNVHDPIVIWDSEFEPIVIAKRLQEANPEDTALTKSAVDTTKTEGIYVPIVHLNNVVIDRNKIQYMTLFYDDILPRLNLQIEDNDNILKLKDSPGANNSIQIVMTFPLDGIYKKISLEFYINKVKMFDNNKTLLYECTLNSIPLSQPYNYLMCGEPSTTYEFCKEITLFSGFGYQVTKGCAEIEDKELRFLRGETFLDAIKYYRHKGGLDENSIFDMWIDLYNNLVLVNLADIFKDNPNEDQLAIYSLSGMPNTSSETPDKQVKRVKRCLTNFRGANVSMSNLFFDNAKKDNPIITTDTTKIQEYGSEITAIWFTPKNGAGNDNYHTEDLKIIENSVDGLDSYKYQYRKLINLGVDCSSSGVMLKQELLTELFLAKHRINKTIIELNEANFALQRGTLIDVAYFAYGTEKGIILNSVDNAITPDINNNNIESQEPSVSDNTKKEVMSEDGTPVLDLNKKSGRYYIDAMTITYDYKKEKFGQKLTLLKVGPLGNYAIKLANARYHTDSTLSYETESSEN